VGFLNKRQEDDEELPGSGLHVDLGVRVCPECRKEALPWQEVCADCGVAPVAPEQLPASDFPLPAHLLEGLEDEHDDPATSAPEQTDDSEEGPEPPRP
jgi:hypothetical protein